MSERKLFVIDLDGTTLIDTFNIHPKVVEGVKHVKSLGHYVIIATGRAHCAALKFYNEMGMTTPLISLNGARYHNPSDESFGVFETLVSNEVVEFVKSDEVFKHLLGIYYSTSDGIVACVRDDSFLTKPTFTVLPEIGCKLEIGKIVDMKEVSCIEMVSNQGERDLVQSIIKERFPDQGFFSWDGRTHESYIEICDNSTSKWNAVCEVASKLNIPLSNVYTFGDADNDISMISNCENSYAVLNANDNIKSAAKHILDKTNEEGAVGEFLLTFKN